MPFGGRRTKRKTRRKGGEDPKQPSALKMLGNIVAPAAYENINQANYRLYWKRKDPETYKSYDSKYYYPSAINAYNPFNSRFGTNAEIKPELWTERVKRHCNIHRANPDAFRLCVSKKCAPGDGESTVDSSCNISTYLKTTPNPNRR